MKYIKYLIMILVLLCTSQAFAAPTLGKDYTLVNPPQRTNSGKNIEVLEFFFYGCSHCFKLHPYLSAWEKKKSKDVDLIYMPTVFQPAWEPMARTFYALEALGQIKKLDEELYKAWNVNNMILSDAEKTIDFIVKQGVDRKKFNDAYNAFSTESKLMRTKQMQQVYGIRGTPTLIVDGKYLITGLHPADTIKVLDALIDMTRKERAGKR